MCYHHQILINNLFFRLNGHWWIINLIALHCFTVTTSNPVFILSFYFMVTTAENPSPEIDHRANSGRLTSTICLVLTTVTWLQSVNQYFLTQVLRVYCLEVLIQMTALLPQRSIKCYRSLLITFFIKVKYVAAKEYLKHAKPFVFRSRVMKHWKKGWMPLIHLSRLLQSWVCHSSLWGSLLDPLNWHVARYYLWTARLNFFLVWCLANIFWLVRDYN